MILSYKKAGKEAPMHTQTATPLMTEAGEIHAVECVICGPLGIVTTDVWDFMLDHAQEAVS